MKSTKSTIAGLIFIIVPVLALAAQPTSATRTLSFKRNGKLVRSFSLAQAQKGRLAGVKAADVDVFNAWRQERRVYVGYDFFKVLEAVYGASWRKSSSVAFVASDGYISHSDIRPMLRLAAGKTGLIAYKEKGKNGFTPIQHGDTNVDPGPFYLVWSNFKEGEHAAYSDVLKWPYQLVEINLIDTAQ